MMRRRRFAMIANGQLLGVVEAYGAQQAAEGLGRGVDLISFSQLRSSSRLRPLFDQSRSILADRLLATAELLDVPDKYDRIYYPAPLA
jgi:hypothetical protein